MVFSKQGNPWKDSVDYKMNKEISDKEKQLREKEKQFVQTLRSGNTKAILETIKEIREHGRITIITEIIDLLLDTDNDEIKDSASALLNDLKSQEAVPSIVAALKDKTYQPVYHFLVAACWQNGLDYHDEVMLFAALLLSQPYDVAIEAYTVIEGCIGDLEDPEIVKLTSTLNNGLTAVSEEKKPLVESMIEVIREF